MWYRYKKTFTTNLNARRYAQKNLPDLPTIAIPEMPAMLYALEGAGHEVSNYFEL